MKSSDSIGSITIATATTTATTTASATATAAATESTTTAAAAASGRWTSFVHGEVATIERLTVGFFNRLLGRFIIRHRDECKSARSTGFTISCDEHFCDCTKLTKKLSQRFLRSLKREISYIQLHNNTFLQAQAQRIPIRNEA